MIQSVNNKKIKEYAKLIQKKERDKTNLFLVEGEHMVKEAFNANALQELFIPLKNTNLLILLFSTSGNFFPVCWFNIVIVTAFTVSGSLLFKAYF